MEGTSSFSQIEGPAAKGWQATGRSFLGGLEAGAASIPLSLGCALLVYSSVAPELVASGVFATMLALAFFHLVTAGSRRPVFAAARTFEATTLAAMLDQAVSQLAGWGLADTPGVRLAFLCAIGGGAGLFVCLLYLLRAERLTPFIPAPVFAGFSNSIAVALLISQSQTLWQLFRTASAPAAVATIVLASLSSAVAVRRWLPRRPAAAVGLAVGLLAGLLWSAHGQATPVVSASGWQVALPMMLADFRALGAPGVRIWPVVLLIAGNAAILGTMVFMNTALAAHAMTQIDGQRGQRLRDGLVTGASMTASGLAGAAAIAGSIMVCLAALRMAPIRPAAMLFMSLLAAAVHLSGVLGWVPLAAVVGVLLYEAWYLVDRPSVQLAVDWLRGRKLPENAREDLALIAAVTALAVVANMVVATFAALVLGLFLFALRSARQPVRHVWTGRQVVSNCARASTELRVLAEHGSEIRVFELEGDMFFAVGASLEHSLHTESQGARCAVLDWSRVRHIDSSVANTVATFQRKAAERGLQVFHAGASARHGNVAEELVRRIPGARMAPDLDFGLELAENQLVLLHGKGPLAESSAVFHTVHLFNGLSPEESAALEQAMTQKLFRSGEVILAAGEVGQELMLILQGCASVIVRDEEGQDVRLAGVRRGAIIGELGFLDGSPRSASVVAQDDVMVASLSRESYDQLCQARQAVVTKLLANIAVALATRLRHTSKLALERGRMH